MRHRLDQTLQQQMRISDSEIARRMELVQLSPARLQALASSPSARRNQARPVPLTPARNAGIPTEPEAESG